MVNLSNVSVLVKIYNAKIGEIGKNLYTNNSSQQLELKNIG